MWRTHPARLYRIYDCAACDSSLDRDVNAACNVLARAFGTEPTPNEHTNRHGDSPGALNPRCGMRPESSLDALRRRDNRPNVSGASCRPMPRRTPPRHTRADTTPPSASAAYFATHPNLY